MKILTLIVLKIVAVVPAIVPASVPALSSQTQTPISLFPISKEAKPEMNAEMDGKGKETDEYWDKKGWISSLQNIFKPPLDWNKNPSPTTTITPKPSTVVEPESTNSVSEVSETREALVESTTNSEIGDKSEPPTEQPVQPDVLIARPQDEEKGDDKRKKMPWLANSIVKHPVHPGVVANNQQSVWNGPQESNKPEPQVAWEDKKPGQFIPPEVAQPVASAIQQWIQENRPTYPVQIDANGRPIKLQTEGKPPKPIDEPKEETRRPSPIKPSYDPPPWEKPNQNNRPFQSKPVANQPNPDFDLDFEVPQYPQTRPQLKPPPNVRPVLPDPIPESQPVKVGRPEEQKGWAKPPIWGKPYPEPGGDTNGLGGNIFGDGTGNGIGGMGNVNGIGGGIIGSGSGNGEGGLGNVNGIGGNIIEDNAANGVGGSGDENGLGGFVVGNGSGNGKGGVGNQNGIGGNKGGKHSANGTGGVGNHNGKGGIIIGSNSGNGIGGVNENWQRPRP